MKEALKAVTLMLSEEGDGSYNIGAANVALELLEHAPVVCGALLDHDIKGAKLWHLYSRRCKGELQRLIDLDDAELRAYAQETPEWERPL